MYQYRAGRGVRGIPPFRFVLVIYQKLSHVSYIFLYPLSHVLCPLSSVLCRMFSLTHLERISLRFRLRAEAERQT